MARGLALIALFCLALRAQDFPPTPAETLTGKKVEFPGNLRGAISVVAFGFGRETTDQITVWLESLTGDGINAWAVANLDGLPAPTRAVTRVGMRKGTPSELQSRTLVASKNLKEWKQVLDVKRDDVPVLALFDPEGNLVWQRQGTFSASISDELKAEIVKLARK